MRRHTTKGRRKTFFAFFSFKGFSLKYVLGVLPRDMVKKHENRGKKGRLEV
jgi:hypothetical protein